MPTEGGGVDYLISSDDPIDEALFAEFRDRACAQGQLMQHITADPANLDAETWARMEEGQEQVIDLQARIAGRGQALRDAGQALADEAAFLGMAGDMGAIGVASTFRRRSDAPRLA